jgi:membrane-associated phospholipid phosphatase
VTRRRRALAALVAVGLAAAFVLTYVVMVRTAWGQAADVRLFQVVFGLVPGGWPAAFVTAFARAAVIVVLGFVVALLGVASIGRRSWASLFAAVVIVGIPLSLGPYLRDELLTRPAFTPEAFPQNSLPSTHATVAAALTFVVILLWPGPRPWWLVNTMGVVLLLVAVGNVVSQAHRPSDVVASFFLSGSVAAAALALVGTSRPRH